MNSSLSWQTVNATLIIVLESITEYRKVGYAMLTANDVNRCRNVNFRYLPHK